MAKYTTFKTNSQTRDSKEASSILRTELKTKFESLLEKSTCSAIFSFSRKITRVHIAMLRCIVISLEFGVLHRLSCSSYLHRHQ